MCSFNDKVVLVTGSTRGIGKAIALEFAKRDAKVILNYRKRDEEAKKTLSEIKEYASDVLLVKADVSKSEDVSKLFRVVEENFSGVDILVNNAGLGIAYPFIEYPEDLWDRLININLKSAYLCSKYAARYMIKRKWGRIINITSIAGLIGIHMLAPYSAAKAGLIGLTRVLAIELSPYNITVNAVAAGLVKTRMGMSVFKLMGGEGDYERLAEEWAKKHTLIGRLLEPYEVARVVLFLADEESDGITGQIFIIDGGQTIVEGRFGI